VLLLFGAGGRLVYACAGLEIPDVQLIKDLFSESDSFPYPEAIDPSSDHAFKLHSRPGSPNIIYLDFDGHDAWNTAWFPKGVIHTPPYSLDEDPAFSEKELRYIVSIWRSVSEDYAPFDVDVTTEYPGSEDLLGNRDGSGRGIRVAVGGSSYSWYGQGAGGVAYMVSGWQCLGSMYCFFPQFLFSWAEIRKQSGKVILGNNFSRKRTCCV
jgi:hypothetical protein